MEKGVWSGKIVSGEMKELIDFENASGKLYARGFDKEGCALLYLKPGLENSDSADGQIMLLSNPNLIS